jgi:hypothetical protein
MLGIDDTGIWLAYVLCIASTLLCVVYGIINWNRGDDSVKPEDTQWATHEKQVQEEEAK